MPRNFEDNVNVYFDRAAAFSGHPTGLLEQIRACNGVHAFQFRYCQVDEKLADRPPRYWARGRRERAMLGVRLGS